MSQRILMVDDDVDFIAAMTTLLEANGYEVFSESNARKGFEAAQSQNPDMLLLDVMMPQIDGFDMARALHDDEKTKNLPVIMITGVRKQMGPAFKFQPDDTWLPVKAVLEKPVDPEKLLTTIQQNL